MAAAQQDQLVPGQQLRDAQHLHRALPAEQHQAGHEQPVAEQPPQQRESFRRRQRDFGDLGPEDFRFHLNRLISGEIGNQTARHRRSGKVLEAFDAPQPEPVLSPAAADTLLDVLRGAKEDRDWSGCNGAIRNLLTIYGIDAKTINVKGGGVDALLEAIKTPPGARDAEIAALEAKEREGANNGPDAG